jgi:hypothetical protein
LINSEFPFSENYLSTMAAEMLPETNSKKRRIMIITGDESIIEQIQNSGNSSLIKSYIIEPKEGDNELCYSPVKKNLDFIRKKNSILKYRLNLKHNYRIRRKPKVVH